MVRKRYFKKGCYIFLTLALTLGLLPSAAMTVLADDSGIYEQLELKKDELTGNVIRTSEDKDESVKFDATAYFYDSTYTCTYTGAYNSTPCTTDGGFPADGRITVSHPDGSDAAETSVTYQLPSYTGKDCYKFTGSSSTATTMHLQTLGAYDYIYVLAVAGGVDNNTNATFNITLNYTEGSEQEETFMLYDWFTNKSSTNAIALYSGVKRGDHATQQWRNCGSTTGAPYLLSIKINADATRLLSSISFERNSNTPSGVNCAVFAVTGAVSPLAPAAPVATAATDLNTDGSLSFTANWNKVDGADGYRIDVSEYSNFCDSAGNPSFVSGYNNYAVPGDGNTTSCTVDGLSEGKTYYYRVRAVSNISGQSLSSNRILATLPQWVLDAGLGYDKVSFVETEEGVLNLMINSDLTLTDTLMLPDGKNVTVDLGGHTVTAPAGKPAVSADSGAKVSLTIADSSSGGGGKLTGSNGNGASASGNAAIDLSNATAGSSVNVSDLVTITGGNGADAAGSENAGAGGAAIIIPGSATATIGSSATVIGGKGGNANNGSGGNGGDGISGGQATVSEGGRVTGGNGGNSATAPGTGGASGVTGTGGTDGQAGVMHAHTWGYSTSGTSIFAYCSNTTNADSCSCQGKQNAVSISLMTKDVVYTGAPVLALTSPTEGSSAWTNAGLSLPDLSYKGIGNTTYTASATAPTNVGTYQVTMTAGGKSVEATFEVLPKSLIDSDMTITLSPESFEFSSSEQSPEVTVTDTTNNITLVKDTAYTLGGDLRGTAINSYTITVTGIGNYKDSVNKTWRITKKLPEISELPTAASITYGETLRASDLTGGKAKRGETEIAGTFQWKDSTIKPAVADSGRTTYEVVFKPENTEEYESVTCNVTLTVSAKPVKLLWSNTSLTYNGTNQIPKAVVSNLEDADKGNVTVAVSGEQVNTATDSGYIATAISLDGDAAANYELSDTAEHNQTTFKIYPKKLTAAMVNATTSYVYNGATITPEVFVKDGTDTLSAGSAYTLSGDTSGKDVKNDYKLTVTGMGNYSGTVDVAWKITDAQMPTGTIKVSANQWQELADSLNFDICYKEKQTVTITAADEGSGVDKVSYFLTSSDTLMNQETLAALPESKWKIISNGGSFTINPDNKYVIYAKITDKSGNVTYISSDGIILDKTAPVITGIQNNKTYCSDVSFTVSDAIGLKPVKVDATDAVLQSNGSYKITATGEKATHTIVAEDMAGNKISYTITINASGSHSFGDWKVTTPATCDEDGVESHTCFACGLVETQIINKIGHQYKTGTDDAHFVWTAKTEDGIVIGYDAKAYFVCEHDPRHVKFLDSCIVTREETQKPTQDNEGIVTYIASATNGEITYGASKTTTVAKLEKLGSTANSNIYTSTSVADNAPSTRIDAGLTVNLAKDLMTLAEQASYDSATVATDVTLYLEVQSITGVVASGEADKVEAQLSDLVTAKAYADTVDEVQSGAEYLDLSMYKKVKTEERNAENVIAESESTTKITDTQSKLKISVEIPEDLRTVPTGYVRTYHIIRVHNDQAEVLDTQRTGNQLTFETDKFSTYAIAYVDVKDPTVTPPAENNTNNSNNDYSGGTIIVPQPVKPEDDPKKEDTEKEEPEKDDPESGKETTGTVDRTFRKLQLAEAKAIKNAVKVSWKQVEEADGYVLYGAPCNTKDQTYTVKKLAVIKNGQEITYTDKNLKSGTYYKYYIKAYKLVDGKISWIARSKTIHVTTTGGKYGNAKAVKVNRASVSLAAGKTFAIKAEQIADSKPIRQHTTIKYESTDTKVATVNSKGVIKAKGKGTCYIYVYAQNGVYKRIKVTVK